MEQFTHRNSTCTHNWHLITLHCTHTNEICNYNNNNNNIHCHPGHHPPTSFSSSIHLCLHHHWHPHDLSITKHSSVHYLIAAVQNLRNSLSGTPVMLIMIDMTFKSMNVLRHTSWGLSRRVNLYIFSSFKSPLLHCHCSLST